MRVIYSRVQRVDCLSQTNRVAIVAIFRESSVLRVLTLLSFDSWLRIAFELASRINEATLQCGGKGIVLSVTTICILTMEKTPI